MRRLPLALLAATLAAQDLATTGDGGQLYFVTNRRLVSKRNLGLADTPAIYRW
jgi:hypothetical protein